MNWSYLVHDIADRKFSLFEAIDSSDADHNRHGPEVTETTYHNLVAANSEVKLVMRMHESNKSEVNREKIHIVDAEFCCQWFDRKNNCLIKKEKTRRSFDVL